MNDSRRTKRPDWLRPNRDAEILPHKKRLRGLDEFVKPAFVGRMARIERRRQFVWYAMLAGAVALGVWMGLVIL